MSRAQDLFDRLVLDGPTAVATLLATKQSESLFLDFKRSADNGTGAKLHQTDRNNLSKAISGFGNSEGGVIVWGVECKDTDGSGDYARDKVPVQNPQRFKAWLEGAVSGATLPPHTGVLHEVIALTEAEGLVVTLIPKARLSPLQATFAPQYYVRAGSDFQPATHGLLRGMFGHPEPPLVSHAWISRGAGFTPIMGNPTSINIMMDLCVTNHGPGLARDVFVNVTFDEQGPVTALHFDRTDQAWPALAPTPFRYSIVSPDSFKLAPEATVTVFNLHVVLKCPGEHSLTCKLSYGNATAPVSTLHYGIDTPFLRELVERTRSDSLDRINDAQFAKLFHSGWRAVAV